MACRDTAGEVVGEVTKVVGKVAEVVGEIAEVVGELADVVGEIAEVVGVVAEVVVGLPRWSERPRGWSLTWSKRLPKSPTLAWSQ